MNKSQNRNWLDTKAKIKAKWSKFSNIEIDGFKDHLDGMPALIQKIYKISKERADKEFSDFKKTLQFTKATNKTPDAQGKSAGKAPTDTGLNPKPI